MRPALVLLSIAQPLAAPAEASSATEGDVSSRPVCISTPRGQCVLQGGGGWADGQRANTFAL